MTKDEAMRLALDALENHTAIKHPQQMHYRDTAIEALRQALEHHDDAAWAKHLKEPRSEKRVHESDTMERECNPHPDAPHGFNRDASHGLGRYVCDCEGWEPPTVSKELQAMPEKTDNVAQKTQPEQKSVAWFETEKFKQLSNEEIDEIASQLDDTTIGWSTHEFARAIEDEIRAKNGF